MAEKALIKEFTLGIFENGMNIVAMVDYCRTTETIPVAVTTDLIAFDATPNEIQVALTAATIDRGTTLGFTLTNADIYMLDLIKGVP